jgi:2OG-Fe dioxygenase
MADGGRYRRRSFAAFAASSGAVTRKPHKPHYQSRDHDPLNGGIERWFTPVSDSVSANGFTRGILGVCTTIFDVASPAGANGAPWHADRSRQRPVGPADTRRCPPGWRRLGLRPASESLQCIERRHSDLRSRGTVAWRVHAHRAARRGLSRRSARASRRYAYRSVGSWLESLTRCSPFGAGPAPQPAPYMQGPVRCLRRSLPAGGESRKMRRKYMWWLIAVVAVVLLGAALWGRL